MEARPAGGDWDGVYVEAASRIQRLSNAQSMQLPKHSAHKCSRGHFSVSPIFLSAGRKRFHGGGRSMLWRGRRKNDETERATVFAHCHRADGPCARCHPAPPFIAAVQPHRCFAADARRPQASPCSDRLADRALAEGAARASIKGRFARQARELHPGAHPGQPGPFRRRAGHGRRPGLRGRQQRARCSRSSRSRSRWSTGSRSRITGPSEVLRRVGVEPTGEAFNSIVMDEVNNRPFNPMVNAGAIATTSLIKGNGPEERFARILGMFSRYAGRKLIDRSSPSSSPSARRATGTAPSPICSSTPA